MLWALVFACAGLGATTLPRPSSEGVQRVWVFEPSESGAILSSPRVEGDRVYVAAMHSSGFTTFGVVYCLDRETGKELWKFDDDGEMKQVFSTPCLADGRLYIGEGLHENQGCKFYCLNAATGRKLWHFETTSHTESSPCVAEGKVFFGAGDDGLYCLDAAKGTQHWHFQEPLHIDANPIVEGKHLYIGSGVSRTHKTTELLCLDTARGKVTWRKRTDLPAWGSPTVHGGQVFFGLGNGRMNESVAAPERPDGAVVCVDAATGEQVWRYDVSDGVLLKPAVDAHHVYFGSRDRHCYCLDRVRGELLWKVDLASPIVAAPALLDKHLYVAASEGRVCCLEADSGKVAWTFDVAADSQLKSQLIASPAVVRIPGADEEQACVFVGTGLESSLRSVAALYCLQGQ
jgi:outer membrane protein assembly factor BamB